MNRLWIAGLSACLLLAATATADAVEAFAPSAAEMRLLPPFCVARISKGGSAAGVPEAAKFGANWLHIHHYCYAVNFVNRARAARDPKDRTFNLGLAKGNYSYVIKATEPRFWMRPQVYVELGKVELQLKETAQAEQRFSEAISFNPAYEPAYQALIDLYQLRNRESDALKTATDGLRHVPNSESLQKAYLALGGKKPFPEPVAKVEPDASGAVAQDAAPGAPAATGGSDAASEAPPAADGAGNAPAAMPPAPETGCRFCPPEDVQRRWRGGFRGGKE